MELLPYALIAVLALSSYLIDRIWRERCEYQARAMKAEAALRVAQNEAAAWRKACTIGGFTPGDRVEDVDQDLTTGRGLGTVVPHTEYLVVRFDKFPEYTYLCRPDQLRKLNTEIASKETVES